MKEMEKCKDCEFFSLDKYCDPNLDGSMWGKCSNDEIFGTGLLGGNGKTLFCVEGNTYVNENFGCIAHKEIYKSGN